MKPGYQSTEFWLTTAANLIGVFLIVYCPEGHTHEEIWMAHACKFVVFLSMVLANVGYAVSRGLAKGKGKE